MMGTATAENSLEKSNATSLLSWLVCFSAALFWFYEFIQMNMFNAISSNLMSDFHINAKTLGYLSATYFLGDVLFLFPAGMILDRFSVRKVIISAMILCIAGTLVFATTHSIAIAAIAHFVAGIGNAFSFLGCFMLVSRWFPPRRMALVTGLIVTFAMAGGIVAQTPLTLLNEYMGWRHALLLNVILGVVILTLIWFLVIEYPPHQKELIKQRRKELSTVGFMPSILQAIRNSQNWFAGIYTSLLNLPIMLLGALFGTLHLIQVHHLTPEKAANVTTMIFLGSIIGAPLVGWLSDRFGLRKTPMIIFAVLAIANILAIIYLPNLSYHVLILLYLLLGIITIAQVISYPLIAESNPRYLTGTAMGLASVLIMAGGAISQPLFGWLLDLNWNHVSVNGSPLFSNYDFTFALAMIPIAFVIGLAAACLLRETHCQPFDKATD